jgi:uracil phosphoribosyltransferase
MASKYELSYSDELKINNIFKIQGWPVDNSNKSSLFNRFRERCQDLNDEERALFYKLSINFKWISLNEYMQLLSELLTKIVTKHFNSAQHIYVYPIKKEVDYNKIKSADVTSYLCKSTQIKHIDKLSKKTFKIVTTYDELASKHKTENKPFIILDDYIGSGQYTYDVTKELTKAGIPKSNIIISTLFISQNGKKSLEEAGYCVEYIEELENALSTLNAKEIKILSEIEKTLHVDEKFSFGFNKSANLISLIRTPNNTLPIFWFKNSSRVANAPFERRKEG